MTTSALVHVSHADGRAQCGAVAPELTVERTQARQATCPKCRRLLGLDGRPDDERDALPADFLEDITVELVTSVAAVGDGLRLVAYGLVALTVAVALVAIALWLT